MRLKGQITVFLSLSLLLIMSLLLGLIESARMAGALWYVKASSESAMASVFSQYHRQLWEQYRLFFLECEEETDGADQWLTFLEPYETNHGWYPFCAESAQTEKVEWAVGEGGVHLEQEILDYMRYGVFDIDKEPGHAEELLAGLKESNAVNQLSRSYESHAKDAVKLEQVLENIYGCLDKQQKYYQSAQERLEDQDGSGFRKEAERMQKEMARIQGLVNTYKRRADDFAEKIRITQASVIEQQENLTEETSTAIGQTAASYESYTAQDGARRKEIEVLPQRMKDRESVIEAAIARSIEVEEEIAAWDDSEEDEDEDDEDEPDASLLWAGVADIWNSLEVSLLSFAPGLKDKEKQGFLESIGNMAGAGLLSVVMPEGKEISQGLIDKTNAPSVIYIEEKKENSDNLVDRLLVDEYCTNFFTNVLSEAKKEVLYEQEYIIGGKDTDRENLAHTVACILAVREGFNLVHILSDAEKTQEARALACIIAGVAGATPLTDILTFFVMTVWALGEALADVRSLLAGGHVPLIKTRESWKLTLQELLDIGKKGAFQDAAGDGSGLDYTAYMKLLLFVEDRWELYYRMMDMIQMNIQYKQTDFRMADCIYMIKIRADIAGKHLFFSGLSGNYPIRVYTEKAY